MDRAGLLARLARVIAEPPHGRDVAYRLAEACRQVLEVDGASITFGNTTVNRVTLGVTDDTAGRFEELQDVLTEGPSFDAFRMASTVVTDLGPVAQQRWPQFTHAARQIMVDATIIALPMRPAGQILGVLSLYRNGSREGVDPADLPTGLDQAQFLADTVGAALMQDESSEQQIDGIPWSNRARIHQGTGMIVAQLGVRPEDALALMRAHAFAHDSSLETIAGLILDRTLHFGGSVE